MDKQTIVKTYTEEKLKPVNLMPSDLAFFDRIFTHEHNNLYTYRHMFNYSFDQFQNGVSQAFLILGDRNSGKSHFLQGEHNEVGMLNMHVVDIF